MARAVVLGAGISGHTCASYLRFLLPKKHEVVVVSPNEYWNWIPSNIWVGVGMMKPSEVIFPLRPLYDKHGIVFKQARATSIHPEGDESSSKPFVMIEYSDSNGGTKEKVFYDYLVNGTGPKLNFDATEGLGPGKNSLSVCTPSHADEASLRLKEAIAKLKKGERQTFLIGTGHGMATCQGAAFEYIFNIDFVLRQAGVREKADVYWISNEYDLGDFGMDGFVIKRGGYLTPSKVFTESLFEERGVHWVTRAHINKVDTDRVFYENLDSENREQSFDFSMLIPPFSGVGLKAYAKDNTDISSKLFNPGSFSFVDADYTSKAYEDWDRNDWPSTYQSPIYDNIFAVGIAFAPPHPISRPRVSKSGTPISPTPPRTGMPSATIGRSVAISIANLMKGKDDDLHKASMAHMGAACVASAGKSFFKGTAAAMTLYPIVPDYKTYPKHGRDVKSTFGEIGLGAHWIKSLLHYLFIYKAKLKPFWYALPE